MVQRKQERTCSTKYEQTQKVMDFYHRKINTVNTVRSKVFTPLGTLSFVPSNLEFNGIFN